MGKLEKQQRQEEDDERRKEAAIASSAALRPNFKASGVSQHQLSKLRELHRRRLQLKSKLKNQSKSKDKTSKAQSKVFSDQRCANQCTNLPLDKPTTSVSAGDGNKELNSIENTNADVPLAPKKRQKLFWGLDTRERWERKSNM